MNLRALTLKHMGWCPSVKAAAQFIPDRDIRARAKGKELLLIVMAGLLVGSVFIYVTGPVYHPYEPEVLEISLENVTMIPVDADWAKGTWFDWDPLYDYAFDLWIIAEPC